MQLNFLYHLFIQIFGDLVVLDLLTLDFVTFIDDFCHYTWIYFNER